MFSPSRCAGQVCEELRADPDFPDGLPIIMMSASTDEASILRGLQAGQPRMRTCYYSHCTVHVLVFYRM